MRHGFLLIDKPNGPTSHDIVDRIRKALPEPKVGHLGTLDPAAEGLLVLAIGSKALKIVEFFNDLPKEYEAEIEFGSISSTYDREGAIEKANLKPGWIEPDHMAVRRAIEEKFMGAISQVPPAHSAVHVGGKRAYESAREGKQVTIAPREVEITECEILSYAYPILKLRVACGSGTYIRSLAHDLGTVLRSGAYLKALRRTKVGKWNVADAVKPDRAVWTDVIPLKDILKDFQGVEITDSEAKDIGFGRAIPHEVKPGTIAWHQDLPIAILEPLKDGSRTAKPRKVF